MTPFGSGEDLASHRMRALGLWGSRAVSARDVVRRLVAVQAQEHAVARWSVAQRIDRAVGPTDINEAFDRGELVRTHVLRPTWHYVSPDDLRWLVRFSGPRVATRTVRYWGQFGLDAARLAVSTDAIAGVVEDGPCTRSELGERLGRRGPELAAMVMHAELHMAICSGPMRGRQHTYVAFDQRARGDGPVGEDALELLARRYFTTRGPATVYDFAWWAGLTMAEARHGLELAAEHLHFHDEGGRRYAFAAHDDHKTQPTIDLVQCYDEVVVSYRQSRDILKTPTVAFEPLRREDGFIHLILRGGRLFGRWRLAGDGGSIEIRLAHGPSRAERDLLEDRREELRRFLTG